MLRKSGYADSPFRQDIEDDAEWGGTLKTNTLIDNYVYSSGKPTSWRTRTFATKSACDAAVAGHSDNTDGEIEREKYTATYNMDGTLATFKRDRDL